MFPAATTEHTIAIPRLVFESDALGELQAVTSSVCERSQPVYVSWPSNASAAQDQEQEQEQELRDKLSSVLHRLPCSSYDVSTSDLREYNVPFVQVPGVKFFMR